VIDLVTIIGCDVGQAKDPTGLAVVDLVSNRAEGRQEFHCRHIERLPLGTLYDGIINRVVEIAQEVWPSEPIAAFDATGVGRPVVELARKKLAFKTIGITITGGDAETLDGDDWRVAKVPLITTLQIALQLGESKIAAELPGVEALVEELLNYRVEIRGTHETFNAREGQHDDLVLALACAVYVARRVGVNVHPRSAGPGYAFGGLPELRGRASPLTWRREKPPSF
jgi:hypothetical protein